MDKEQADVFQLVANVYAKLGLAFVVAVAYVAITVRAIIDPDWPIAAIEFVSSGTIFVVFKHYFPTKG